MYVEPAHGRGAKRRRSDQSSAENTSRSSSSSASASSAIGGKPLSDVAVVPSDRAPATHGNHGPHPAKKHTNPHNRPTKDRIPVDDVGDFDLGTTSDFMSLLETVAPNNGGGRQEDEMAFTSCSTTEANDVSRLSFCSDFTTLEPMVEDYLGFEFEVEPNDKLNEAGTEIDDTCSYCKLATFLIAASVRPC